MSEKMNFEFFTKLGSKHPCQHVPKVYKAYCLTDPGKRAYKVWLLTNVLLRKLCLKFLEDIKTKKIHISALLAVRRLKCSTNPAKFIKIWWTECGILLINLVGISKTFFFANVWSDSTRFRGCRYLFWQVSTEINNNDTLKVYRKITKITDPNLVIFLGNKMCPRMKFPAEH